jgi:protein-tyrosine-phosphatase
MNPRIFNVLFLCTHNSARSVIAECIVNSLGQGRFKGYSAGSQPSGRVNPYALEMLARLNYDIGGLRSKSWDEFAVEGAPQMDFVFTVCDDAAEETCPYWPGQPMTAHWGLPDPSRTGGSEAEIRAAFADTHRMLYQRIGIFVNLPLASLDQLSLKAKLDQIGQMARVQGADEPAA